MFFFTRHFKRNNKTKVSKVNGIVYLTDGSKVIECKACDNVAMLHWKNYGSCDTLPMKLLSDNSTRLNCDCYRVETCSKPYGIWKWSKEKPDKVST